MADKRVGMAITPGSTYESIALKELSAFLYGALVDPPVAITATTGVFGSVPTGLAPNFKLAEIKAIEMSGRCIQLPESILVFVFSDGEDTADPCAKSVQAPKKWQVSTSLPVVSLIPVAGTLDVIIDRLLDGGINISDISCGEGKVCASIRVWVKYAGKKLVDKTWRACISFDEACKPVFGGDIGIAKLTVDLCYTPPNRLCAKFTVGVGGYHLAREECTNISCPHPHLLAEECKCSEKKSG